MAETTKRTTNNTTNSASKSRKSRNDIIRTALGMYLKQKNYSFQEKFRKSDLALTQSIDQYDVSMMLDDDVAKVNSISYSNVLCLSNNQSTVELQFSKFVKFVQSQSVPAIKTELQTLLWPLLCHIYIEMVKGRDSRPASDFLRKYAYLIGPIDNLYSPVVNKQNGNSTDDLEQQRQSLSPLLPSSTTQILFSNDDKSIVLSADTLKASNSKTITEPNNTNGFFKELIQSLSLCLRIDEIESFEIARKFRNAKYEMLLSLQSLYAIKHFLAKNGHVIILHILQTWFSLEIREALIDSDLDEQDMDDDDDDSDQDNSESTAHYQDNNGIDYLNMQHSDADYSDTDDCSVRPTNAHTEIKNLLAKVNLEIKTINGLSNSSRNSIDMIESKVINDTDTANKTDTFSITSSPMVDGPSASNQNQRSYNVVQNKYLQNIRAAVIRSRRLEPPMRVFNVMNADYRLCAGDIDPNECHLACSFDDATIKLWQLNQSRIRGRKPFSPFSNRLCEWSLENCESSSSDDDSDREDSPSMLKNRNGIITNRLFGINNSQSNISFSNLDSNSIKGTKRKKKHEQREVFMQQRCDENIFTDTSGLTLRGHNKGVTDILFSKYSPLLFSVSKDNTMRAWKASDYKCGAIYRGHNYPIWCVAESSTGLYIATGSRDLTARLWSTDREHPLQTYIGHTQDVDAIAFHPNGNYIATGSTDLTVRLWDVTSGKLLRVFIDCHLPVHCVSFSPDGKYLAAAGEESKIRIFDLAAGSQLTELKDHTATINSIVWNFSGTKMASCCADGSLRVYTVNRISQQSSTTIQSPTATTSNTLSSSSSSSSNSSKLMISNDTGCKRAVNVFFNYNDTVSCIGNT